MKANLILPTLNLPEVEITNITSNTNNVTKNTLFFAIKGAKFNPNEHLEEIISNGAKIIITDEERHADNKIIFAIPKTIKRLNNNFEAFNMNNTYLEALANFNKVDLSNFKFLAVTGTNGKTTTAWYIVEMLEALKEKVAYIGTLGFYDGHIMHDGKFTTPMPNELISMLSELDSETKYVVLEASSHAAKQLRLGNINLDCLMYTNFTEDHLDYHVTLEEYYLAKTSLVENVSENGQIIINGEDEKVDDFFKKYVSKKYNVIYPSLDAHYCKKGITLYHEDDVFETPIIGEFNQTNLLLALNCLIGLGFSTKDLKNVTTKLTPPDGRLEIYSNEGKPTVIVDFAHSPDAMEKVLIEAKRISNGKVINIFGVTGERENHLKQEMGDISANLADITIITEDNLMGFDWESNFAAIQTTHSFTNCYDRKEAILNALKLANTDDVITVLGKGSEDYQYGDVDKKIKTPYLGDANVIKKYLGV